MSGQRVVPDVEAVARVLYSLEWDADLYATPRGAHAVRYESRARRLLASAVFRAQPTVAEAKAEAWDEGFRDGLRQHGEGDDGPRFTNPYKASGGARP